MTNFEIITQSSRTLDEFLTAVQNDALKAEGCALEMHLPPDPDPDGPQVCWKDWLEQEAADGGETVFLPRGKFIFYKRGGDGGGRRF